MCNLFYISVTRNHIYEVWSDVPGVFDEGGVVQWSFDDILLEDEKRKEEALEDIQGPK